MGDLFLLWCTVRCTLWAVWLCYCAYSKHSSPYSSWFGWGAGVGSSIQLQVNCSVFCPLVYQIYKAANCGWGEWAADLLQKTKLFRTQLCAKPCYVRAMEICSTFSCCKHCKLVAWAESNHRHKDFQNTCSSKTPYLQCLQRGFVSRATDRATAKPHKFVARFYVTTTPLFCKWGGIGKKTPPQKFLLVAKNPQLNFLWAADPFPCCVYKTYKQPTTHTNHCNIACGAHSLTFCSSSVFRQIARVLTL